MLLTDSDNEEKNRISVWASKHIGEINMLDYGHLTEAASYFIDFDNSDNCVEYSFDSIPELQMQLEKLWGNDDTMRKIILPCMVATFKGKPRPENYIDNQTHTDTYNNVIIPDFVYAF